MPVGELIGEAVGGAVRFVGRILAELVAEVLVRGTGHLLIRAVRPCAQPSEKAAAIVGVLAWLALAAAAFILYRAAR